MQTLQSIIRQAKNAKENAKFINQYDTDDDKQKKFVHQLDAFCKKYGYKFRSAIYVRSYLYSFDSYIDKDGREVFEVQRRTFKPYTEKVQKQWESFQYPTRGKGWKVA